MLYKNDEQYKLTAADHKELKKKFHKFPVRMVYPDSRIQPSKSKHNILPDKPNSVTFPLVSTVRSKTGIDTWRFAENKIIGQNGNLQFVPKNLVFRGQMVLQESDSELLFWLWKCCPVMEGGQNHNGRLPKVAIEDLVGAAELKAIKEEQSATFKAMIYSSHVGLGEDKLRVIAKAYFIPDVDELSFAQVKLAVEHSVYRDKENGIANFLDLVDAEQTMAVKANIMQAIDNEIIKFMPQTKSWAWVTAQGKKNEPIVQISAAAEPHDALYDYYLGDRKFAEHLISALKGSRVALAGGAGADDPNGTPDPE